MQPTRNQPGKFVKVGECLYRYSTSGGYYAVVRHQGKLIRRRLPTEDRAVAKRLLADFKRSLTRIDLKTGRCTLRELAERFMATVQHQAPSTVEGKQLVIDRIKKDWPGGCDVQLKDVRPSHVKTWLALQKQRMGKSSFNGYVQTIRAVFELAREDKLIIDSPAAGIKQLKRDKPIRETPTWEQFKAILEDIRSQKYMADSEDSANFIEFLGLSGLGNGEAASLTRADVDWNAGRVRVYRHKTDQGFLIPIYPQLRPLLESLTADQRGGITKPLFKISSARKSLAGACKRLGFPNFTHRSLRRMFITRAIELGVDVKVIALWQGHRDGGKLILETYSHVRQPHADEMAKLLAEPGHAARTQAG